MSNKTNRLSHSQASQFQTCPTKWRFHYVDKLRGRKQGAGLLFGSAMDHAFTARFSNKGKNPKDIFNYFWRFQEINKNRTYLTTCTEVVYGETEFDEDLLHQEDLDKFKEKYNNDINDFNIIKTKRKEFGFDALSRDEKERYNFLNWHCLLRKGHLMLDALEKQVVPNIEEVLGTQVKVELSNDEGDSIIGYADIVCKWKGYSQPLVLDFKTSMREYDKDQVLTSPQLSLYMHDLSSKYNTRMAGFVVFSKRVIKNKKKICSKCAFDGSGTRFKTCNNKVDNGRCDGEWTETIDPKVWVQILINEVPQATEDLVIENMDYINTAIKNGIFHRNLTSCINNFGKCVYYDKCYYGKDDGLIKV